MRKDVTTEARDAALVSGLLAVIGAYVAAYILLFRWSVTTASIALGIHLAVLALVLIRSRLRPSRSDGAGDATAQSSTIVGLTTDAVAPFVRRSARRAAASDGSACSVTDIATRQAPVTSRSPR